MSSPVSRPEDDISFDNVITSTSMGMVTTHGEVSNKGTKACSFTIKVSFYDDSKKLVGTASGAVNNLNGGSTKIFGALGNDDISKATSYKVQVDTMISQENNSPVIAEFSNLLIKNLSGITTIDGEVKNIDTKAHSFTINVGAYDSDGKLIGVSNGAINDLAAGDTKTFSTMSTGDLSKAAKFKVFVDTVVE